MEEVIARLHVDPVVLVAPKYVGPPVPEDGDEFGCLYTEVSYGPGVYRECVYHPLDGYGSVEEIERNYAWPSADWYNYSAIPEKVAGVEDRLISGGGGWPLTIYKRLRGEEQAFVDLILHPDIVHYGLDKLYDLYYEKTVRVYEQIPGRVSMTSVSEDLGAQEGLMYSPEHIREFLFPRMKRMMDLVRGAGARVWHHNCGSVRKILPDLIEIGIEILDPVQWRCRGMEREGLKKDFGDRLIFHGGVYNQYTLAFESVDEVRREVVDNLRILGEGGGYILGPCHNIQTVSPPENIVAMYETGYESGWVS